MEKIVESFLAEDSEWTEVDGKLAADYIVPGFAEMKLGVAQIMQFADYADHHPTVTFGYNTLTVTTVTHDAGDTITEKDIELARAVSDIMTKLVV